MRFSSLLTRQESVWQSRSLLRHVPENIADWLFDQGSLTTKLVRACQHCGKGRFRVEVINQAWGRPLYSERRLLKMRHGEVAFIREVKLHCDDQSWVFARTLIPASSFRGAARRLAFLGDKPLGAVLFADPRTRRRQMQFSAMHLGNIVHDQAVDGSPGRRGDIWGRRTLFVYGGQPLLVYEIFLPKLLEVV